MEALLLIAILLVQVLYVRLADVLSVLISIVCVLKLAKLFFKAWRGAA